LDDEVTELVRELRSLGIIVDLRARMHEKIAIIDGHILWHGSLNILSHRDTHESMLRLDSPAACQQLSRFVRAAAGRREEDSTPSLEAPENPVCPKCGGPTVWKDGRYGIYFQCENPDCDGKVDPRRGRSRHGAGVGRQRRGGRNRGAGVDARQPCPEPGCTGQLVERNGRFGRFLGCSNYPGCRHTEILQ
jgi:ssDNA-binding Zn-finger/Zn-ribbon topoisomerase 1